MPTPPVPQSTVALRAAAVAFVAAAAVTLGACAPTQTQQLDGAAGQVQEAVKKFSDAAGDGGAGVICRDLVTSELRKQLGSRGKSCEDAVRAAIENSDYTPLTVDTVRLDKGENGNAATAITATSVEDRYRGVKLEKVGDKWLIASFEATAKK